MRKVFPLAFKPSSEGVLLRLEVSELDSLSVDHQPRTKEARLMPLYATEANLGILANLLVLVVLGYRRLAQVVPSAVRWIAVNVINPNSRPFASDEKPSKSVRPVEVVSDTDVNVSVWSTVSSRLAFSDAGNPFEYSSVGIVGNEGARLLGGKILFSHDAPVKLIGQRPEAISGRSLASLFCLGID